MRVVSATRGVMFVLVFMVMSFDFECMGFTTRGAMFMVVLVFVFMSFDFMCVVSTTRGTMVMIVVMCVAELGECVGKEEDEGEGGKVLHWARSTLKLFKLRAAVCVSRSHSASARAKSSVSSRKER